jgi:ABC-type phosphate/phosphonate transport system substrate-binding protein
MLRFWRLLYTALFFLFAAMGLPALPLTIGVPAGEGGIAAARIWSGICDYLRNQAKIDVEFRVYENHREVIRNLRDRFIDAAYLDPLWFHRFRHEAVPLVETEIMNRREHSVLIVVPKNSIAYRIEDLSGASFALPVFKETAGGYYVPLVHLARGGLRFQNLGRVIYTDTSAGVLKAVAYGGIDAGSFPSYLLTGDEGKKFGDFIRVIAESDLIPLPLLAVRREERPDKYSTLRDALLSMGTNRAGRRALSEGEFSGFFLPSLRGYETLERYIREFEVIYGSAE